MRQAGYTHTEATKIKMSLHNVGFKGRKHSEETKKRIKETSKKTWSNAELREKNGELKFLKEMITHVRRRNKKENI